MNRTLLSSSWFLLSVGILLLCGCGDARRQRIEGTVTFDGKPIDNGYLKLIPQDGTPGPAVRVPLVCELELLTSCLRTIPEFLSEIEAPR